MSAPSDRVAVSVALDRLLAQDSWEAPYVEAGRQALAALVAENETLRALMRRVLSGEPWGAYANDGSGRTFEDEFRAAARGGDAT
jgi:hypothetical protein